RWKIRVRRSAAVVVTTGTSASDASSASKSTIEPPRTSASVVGANAAGITAATPWRLPHPGGQKALPPTLHRKPDLAPLKVPIKRALFGAIKAVEGGAGSPSVSTGTCMIATADWRLGLCLKALAGG